MKQYPIGVMLESFKVDYDTALSLAVDVGAQGIQVYATDGELAPKNLVGGKRKAFLERVENHGLEISALCGDLMMGFGDAKRNPVLIEESKRILDLAKELGTNIVTTHIGVIPADPTHDRYKIMQEACYELGTYANQMGAHFAIETGPETAKTLAGFLHDLPEKGVAVNFDPANFVMVTGDDPVIAVDTLKEYIVHTHAKDGRKLLDRDPEIIYGIHGAVEKEIKLAKAFIELPLGQGDVDFPNYLAALDKIGYEGYLTIEREVGNQPKTDIQEAVIFLQNQFKNKE
ncbi:sugar phosphate isomerase/epimerase family protein [Carnobacterium gallinarum]|uniref:sugar phosphate isomerase/epimerase family protein n=1 Tax=Carnobacterium gallinarum TaxID=2749 RepID=UPI000552FEA0|nr:sugar phosphate isomerase/epimerase family protein [Carnobacterium gallinarum]